MNPISRSTEYAIRALTYLAQRRGDGKFHLAREMADLLDIPAPFLGKILQPLVTREVLESQRGRNGGFRLALDPEEVTLYRIADTQETNAVPRGCLLGQAECSDERACPMHDYWRIAADAFDAKMANTTLADMVAFCDAKPQSGYPCGVPGTEPPSPSPAEERDSQSGDQAPR